MIQGTCHCGSVRWLLESRPDSATACNCTVFNALYTNMKQASYQSDLDNKLQLCRQREQTRQHQSRTNEECCDQDDFIIKQL